MDAAHDTARDTTRDTIVTHPTPTPQTWSELQEVIQNYLLLVKNKDAETHAHLGRVFLLAEEWMKWLEDENLLEPEILGVLVNTQDFLIATLLHDVGKVGVLSEVLHKETPLTPAERIHLELHSEIGYEMIRGVSELRNVATILRHHHERWDGQGYPLQLSETHIPLESRMIALVDAFDAMTSERVYQESKTPEHALLELRNNAGSQFCPKLTPLFVEFARIKYTIGECPGLTI